MRLIDADAIQYDQLLKTGNKEHPLEWAVSQSLINSMPTIKAEPKHGHWINMGDFEQCSVCNGTHLKEFQTYYGKAIWVKTPYCPNCGAKMDSNENE